MHRFKRVPALLFLVLSLACGKADTEPPPPPGNPEEIARDVARDVGVVGRAAQGGKGAPVILVEERHESKVTQIEHAVVLVRLHEKYGLREVGLEGYLKEDPAIRPDDFGGLSRRSDPLARARVAARLVETGEIGGAEFLKVVYEDVSLQPVERREDRGALATDQTASVARQYLGAIAVVSMTEEERATAAELSRSNGPAAATFILSSDDWTRAKNEILGSDPSVEKEFETVKEISERARSLNLDFRPEERAAMDAHLEYLRRRVSASQMMASAAAEMADRPGARVVALNIGVGHTEAVCDRLQAEGRPFAVVAPASLKSDEPHAAFTSAEMLQRYKGMPPDPDEAVNRLLREAVSGEGRGRLKPLSRLAVRDKLLRAKAEVHDVIDRVAHALLTAGAGAPGSLGPSPTPPGPGPATGGPQRGPVPAVVSLEEFRSGPREEYEGEFVAVDRANVQLMQIEGTDRRVAVIPLTLDFRGPSPTQVWFAAEMEEESDAGGEAVEAFLLKVLRRVRAGKTTAKARPVQISVDIRAVMAPTKDAALKAMSRY